VPVLATTIAITAVALGVGLVAGPPSDSDPTSVQQQGAAPGGEGDREREAVPGTEAGGEATAAASEVVAQNAFPRGYVTSRAALRAASATWALPQALSSSDFRASVSQTTVRAQAGVAWAPVGPVGVIAPPNSRMPQAPVVSGRVTALVVDPACGTAGHGCRMWMASAGGGVWRTADATIADPQWTPVSSDIPSTAIGSLALDPNDATGNTIYAGTGEANGSSDSEAGVGLYVSTDGGDHWSLVPGSRPFGMDRSIGAVAVKPGAPATILVGTARGRHGAGARTNGSLTPPNAPALGAYLTTNGGGSFTTDLAPAQPSGDPAARTDTPRGGVTQVAYDPVDPSVAYAAVVGSGVWRRAASGTWTRIYVPQDPADETSRESFALTAHGATVHMYVLEGGSSGVAAAGQMRRTLDSQAATPSWDLLSDAAVASNRFGASTLCGQQCFYDQSIAASASGTGDTVWAGGSMQYNEVLGWDPSQAVAGLSNGRAVVRSTTATAADPADVTWTDMTVGKDTGTVGSHPDQHAIALNPSSPDQAFLGSDGGIVRTDGGFSNMSSACDSRAPINTDPGLLARCRQLLSDVPTRVVGINSGLSTMQLTGVASTSVNPGALIAGFQDNGTAINGGGGTWTGVIGGDGAQPAFDLSGASIAYHQYYGGTVQVSYDNGLPGSWLRIYEPMRQSGETPPFYAALLTDPATAGTVFSGWQHVWRSTDRGGDRAGLTANCIENLTYPPGDPLYACGDFEPMGPDLTDPALGGASGGAISALARTTGDTTTMWAATSKGRVFVSKNATAPAASVTFARIDDDSTAIPTRFPSAIEVDPTDVNHAWISYAGYNAYTPTTPGHLFEVRFNPAAGTSTWADRSYDLGDVPLRDMTYDPLLGDIYASGDWGVLRLPGGATSWMDAGSALPQVATYNLSIQPDARVLYAGTHGRGVYTLTLPDPAPGPAPPAPMPDATPASTPATATAIPTLSARVLLPRGGRVTAGANGTFVINLAAASQSGTGTITLNGALQPTSGRPTSTRLAQVKYRFTRNHATRVSVRLPAGSRRAVGRAGRMNVTAKVVMRSTVGEAAATTGRMVLVASPRLRANSR